ncbi:MAG TPA: cyclic nucleotide-binding domain-containing protein [Puia sp.]|nr:cyclic nucleotide-binding domain-containing protein [Puia sp.]
MLLKDFIEGAVPVKSFQKGDIIYRQDAHARYFYEIREGEVVIVDSNSEGKEFVQGLYTAGECFGIAALVNHQVYPSAAVANTSCELYVITGEHFFQLLKENHAFHLRVTEIVCRQLQYKTMMLEEFAATGILLQVTAAGAMILILGAAGANPFIYTFGIFLAFMADSLAFAQARMRWVMGAFAASIAINLVLAAAYLPVLL